MQGERRRLVATVRGHVQGVGFRVWTRRLLADLGLEGSASNLPDGTVEVVAEGSREALGRALQALRGPYAPGRVADVDVRWDDAAAR